MAITRGSLTFQEIVEQAESWRDIIKIYNKHRETLIWIKKFGFNQVVFVGAGVSLFIARYASHLFRDVAKMPSLAFSSSEIFSNESLPFDKRLKTLVVAISRSGEAHDTIWAVQHMKAEKPDIQVLSIACGAKSTLHSISDKNIPALGSDDDGVLPIRSFSTVLFLLSLIAGAIGGSKELLAELSSIPKRINIREFHEQIIKMRRINEVKHLVFTGTGAGHPLASYGALLASEMSLTPSMDCNSLEYRHNHFITTHVNTLYTGIMSDRMEQEEYEAMRDAARMRALILLLADDIDEKVEAGVEYSIKFSSGLSVYARAFHVIPCLQLLAYQYSITKGMNPDKPKHITGPVTYRTAPDFIG